MKCHTRIAAAVVLIILIIVLAVILLFGNRIGPELVVGGKPHTMRVSPLEHALAEYAGELNRSYILGPRPHDLLGRRGGARQVRFAPLKEGGNIVRPAKGGKKPWTAYSTWTHLQADADAHSEYLQERTEMMDDLEFDWTAVLAEVVPKLQENREYIGAIQCGPPTDTIHSAAMRVQAMEPSPSANNKAGVFAQVSAALVRKYAARPAMFLFHTHPHNAEALPSATDVSLAISLGFAGRFAANIVISRYGIIMYAPSRQAYETVQAAKDPEKALQYYRHDVAAALEGMRRSWDSWTLDDYAHLYQRHKMLYVVYPSSRYTARLNLRRFHSRQDAASDEELLTDLRESADVHKHIIDQTAGIS